MPPVNVYILDGLLDSLDMDQQCEVCMQKISAGDEARRIEHSWTEDTWRHKNPEHCIHALVVVIKQLILDAANQHTR